MKNIFIPIFFQFFLKKLKNVFFIFLFPIAFLYFLLFSFEIQSQGNQAENKNKTESKKDCDFNKIEKKLIIKKIPNGRADLSKMCSNPKFSIDNIRNKNFFLIEQINSSIKDVIDIEIEKQMSHNLEELYNSGEPLQGSESKESILAKNQDCKNFIDENGHYGPWGLELYKKMKESDLINKQFTGEDKPIFLNPKINLSKFCSNFVNFSENEKYHFWVWIWAGLAKKESTCSPCGINYEGTNCPAIGLFQMELSEELRRKNQRSPECFTNLFNPINNIHCSVTIMASSLQESENPFSKNINYWEPLRRPSEDLLQHIKSYEKCKNPPPPSNKSPKPKGKKK